MGSHWMVEEQRRRKGKDKRREEIGKTRKA